MPRTRKRRPLGDGAADVLLPGERSQHSISSAPQEAPDPIRALLARLDAAMARGGMVEIDGRALQVRLISPDCYGIERP